MVGSTAVFGALCRRCQSQVMMAGCRSPIDLCTDALAKGVATGFWLVSFAGLPPSEIVSAVWPSITLLQSSPSTALNFNPETFFFSPVQYQHTWHRWLTEHHLVASMLWPSCR